MYIPPHFAGDAATARRLIADHPFATLVTPGTGALHVTHLPLTLEGDTLTGHVARPNPHWQALEVADSIAIFHGPHAFVSRGWYENPSDNVPTWNYAAVHVTGRAQLLPVGENRALVERLAAVFEPPGTPATRVDKMERLPQAIVAFRLPLTRVEVKVKMNQNKTAADRRGVIAGLRATGRAEDAAVADWMQAHEPG